MKLWFIWAFAVLCAAGAVSCFAPAGRILDGVPFGTLVLDCRGGIMRFGLAADDKYRLRVSLDEIAPEAINAVLAYEDRYFYRHPGVNPVSILRAAASLAVGRRMGASTLTMQVVRLRYRLATNSITGKLAQILLAFALEARHDKQEILEAYFNLAPYGGNVEGIEAASRVYFHKPASHLSRSEAQALAIVPQNPVARNPACGPEFNSVRARITGKNVPPLKVYGSPSLPFQAPHLSLELSAQNPGKVIQTGIEPDLQARLQSALRAYVARHKRLGIHNASGLLLRWTDMQVCALAGSADFSNRVISGQVDGTRAPRSPGSTLKPFIYALALDQGLIHPRTILPDSPRSFGGYDPENFDRGFRGPVAAHEALKQSRNLPAIWLAGQLREPDLYGFLQRASVRLAQGPEHYGLALALGGAEITMRELAGLYATLVNQGLWLPLRFKENEAAVAPVRLLSPEAAWLTLNMLARPDAAIQSHGQMIPYFFKTGTSNGLRDAWTAGIIGEYVLVIWIGNFDNRPNPEFVGARAALPLFEELARSLGNMRKLGAPAMFPPPGLQLAEAEICAASGDIFAGQCAAPEKTWIIPGVSPVRDSGILRKIRIDSETGLRACAASKGRIEEKWWEFWPSDLRQIFASAGINKPDPPEWSPECKREGSNAYAKAPRIVLPKKNVTYQKRLSEKELKLPLLAATDAGAGSVHWYSGPLYLGSSRPGEVIYWNAPAGRRMITAVDSNGNSVRQECVIEALP